MQQQRAGERTKQEQHKRERKVRSDKKHRVAPSLDSETFGFLVKLSAACTAGGIDCSWSYLAECAIYSALHSPEFVKSIQEQHKTPDDFRLIPHTDLGVMSYRVRGAE